MGDIVVDIDNERNQDFTAHIWFGEMDEKKIRMKSNQEPKRTIRKIPANFHKNFDDKDYAPRIVSFGPYHHGDKSCKPTEGIKDDVVLHSLERSNKGTNDFKQALREVVEDLRGEYNEHQRDTEVFLKLMIRDGCFLLEILRPESTWDSPVWNIDGINPEELKEYYRRDMLLLENQIPMLALVKLLSVQNNFSIPDAEKKLYDLILRFFDLSPTHIEKILNPDKECNYLHVLELYRHSLLYDQESKLTSVDEIFLRPLQLLFPQGNHFEGHVMRIICLPVVVLYLLICLGLLLLLLIIYTIIVWPLRKIFTSESDTGIHFIIPSATELDKVGIQFEKNKTESLKAISFESRKLCLPPINVDGATKSRFLNIIAFEKLRASGGNEITSYIYFMSRLLQDGRDVRLLQLRGIIRTPLHKDHVVKLFKSLTKDMIHDPNNFFVGKYKDLAKALTKSFYIKMNNVWQRDLWQTYLRSPCTVISVVAALFLFTLSSVQTLYTVLSYYNPK